jgi:hypothetical protein
LRVARSKTLRARVGSHGFQAPRRGDGDSIESARERVGSLAIDEDRYRCIAPRRVRERELDDVVVHLFSVIRRRRAADVERELLARLFRKRERVPFTTERSEPGRPRRNACAFSHTEEFCVVRAERGDGAVEKTSARRQRRFARHDDGRGVVAIAVVVAR